MRLANILRTAKAMWWPSRPIILFHKPTERCDCRCRFCDSWLQQPREADVLPSGQILSMLERARVAGMTRYTVWGGEPLLVADLPDWLARARELGMQTVFCTSGRLLSERATEVGPCTDRLILSLEGVGRRHDTVRGVAGLFDAVVAGLEKIKTTRHGEVLLWSNLNRENLDQVEEIARFARYQNMCVEFFPATRWLSRNADVILDPEEQSQVFRRIMDLKLQGYPILNTWYALELMRSARSFRCNIPALSIQVCADGRVYACDPKMLPDLEPYGQVGSIDLPGHHRTDAYRRHRRDLRSCNRCLGPCVANLANVLPLQASRKVANLLYYRAVGAFARDGPPW